LAELQPDTQIFDSDSDAERQRKLALALDRQKALQNRPKIEKQKSLAAEPIQPDAHSFVLNKPLRKWKSSLAKISAASAFQGGLN
jgi:hypothetical protein